MSNQQYNVLPAVLDISMIAGDVVSMLVTFGFDITGIDFTGAITYEGEDVQSFTVDTVSLPLGKINLSLSALDTAELLKINYKWYLAWAGVQSYRTLIAGTFKVIQR